MGENASLKYYDTQKSKSQRKEKKEKICFKTL